MKTFRVEPGANVARTATKLLLLDPKLTLKPEAFVRMFWRDPIKKPKLLSVLTSVVHRAVARILLVGGASWGNRNLSIKTYMRNFKIEKNCISNF